ncbi:MAG: DNA gyrase subunit A [Acidimicrobiales bacterium]|nr:MAG: DNA gyrase subunit A [Acidimicrobiales bacterium]
MPGENNTDGSDNGYSENVTRVEIQEEVEQSFIDYAMSVIVSRALPDVRDGLKPVHRRILWAMEEANIRPDRGHVKCATVVGDVIGKYHPHGDQAVYDALVRMGQSFSLRHPLIDPHGNFGSPSDPPAAYRYTECRLSAVAMEMLADIDEDTVDFVPNFDGRHREPTVLPARFPNLIVNGTQGIAVGMATNIPPHNLREVTEALIYLVDNPAATSDDLMRFVKGPDFPTAGIILGRRGIIDSYRTGRGSIRLRARAEIEEDERRGARIVVTEIPYQISVEQIEKKAAELVEQKKLDGIRDIRNESAQGSTRLVFELRRDAVPKVVLNNLFLHTPMQVNIAVNMVALVDGVPRLLSLRDLLDQYLRHRYDVVLRRSRYRLQRARQRAHIVEGLVRALDLIDRIIEVVRGSEDRQEALQALMGDEFGFSEEQANHILDMQLHRLTRLGRSNLEQELADLRAQIADLTEIVESEARLRAVVKEELEEIANLFGDDRKTEIGFEEGELSIEDLVADEEIVITISARGYIKATKLDSFKPQERGGKGKTAATLKDGDFVQHVLTTTAHSYLLLFSNRGRVYRLRGHEIPLQDRRSRGTAVVNLLELEPGESIQAVIDTRDYETNQYLLFVTKKGQVKKTRFGEYNSSKRSGLIAINLKEGDELVCVLPVNEGDDLLMISRMGQGIRFHQSEVRPMGRSAAGVRGFNLGEEDFVVGADVVRSGQTLLIVTEFGYGKRTQPERFPVRHRGGKGVRAIRVTPKKGPVIAALSVGMDDEVLAITSGGRAIRCPVREIPSQGRDATGVRVMTLEEGERVAAVAPVLSPS